jgi:hypothetical protein
MAWVDGRRLLALALPAPTPAVATAADPSVGWFATHAVGPGGAPAWAAPDPAAAPVARLDVGLGVRVVEQRADRWANVVCANGWSAWVDSRNLVPSGAVTATPPARSGALSMPSSARGWLAPGGAAAAFAGGFLPWLSAGPFSLTAWDLPIGYLITGTGRLTGPKAGLLLLLPLLLAIPFVTHKPLPTALVVAVGAVATNVAVLGFVRSLSGPAPHPHVSIGVFVTLAGGLCVMGDWFSSLAARARR